MSSPVFVRREFCLDTRFTILVGSVSAITRYCSGMSVDTMVIQYLHRPGKLMTYFSAVRSLQCSRGKLGVTTEGVVRGVKAMEMAASSQALRKGNRKGP